MIGTRPHWPLLHLALRSLWSRRVTALLTALSIAISVALLLGVRQISNEARNSFANTVSGVDLIVGARSGPLNLLLYSVFHIGDATNNISYEVFSKLRTHREVAFAITLSLGDSHQGFRVIGTDQSLFSQYSFGDEQRLGFSKGQPFNDLYDAVIGADVARALNYQLGQHIVLAHGTGNVSFMKHDDKPFVITGILSATGTPIDRGVYVSLAAIEAIHVDWQGGVPPSSAQHLSAEATRNMDLTPQTLTAIMIGLKSRVSTFAMQRAINDYRQEPLLAIMPGVTLTQLWDMLAMAERILLLVSAMVALAGLIGLLTTIMASLSERRREMAILRALGARPRHILGLLLSESLLTVTGGVLSGIALFYGLLVVARQPLRDNWGIYLRLSAPDATAWQWLALMVVGAVLASLLPAWRAYRRSLADGLTPRV